MNLEFITRAYGAAKLVLKANAPTIMVVGGVGAMGIGTVLACKQTLQIEEVLRPHTSKLNDVEEGLKLGLGGYSEEAARSDRLKIYTRAALDMTKLYGVPACLFLGGAGLVFGGHRVMVKRNATLALAYAGLEKAFAKYRNRVKEQFGPLADAGMTEGWVTKEFNDESGKPYTGPTRDWEGELDDPYNRIFGQGETTEWQPDLGVNKMFLAHQQKYAQERLNSQGYLYLSEVYKSLGFPENDISRVVGWKVTRNADGSKNFPFVDFGLDKPYPDDWTHSSEKAIYLDFNCQGLIVGGKIQKLLEKA